ncbi:hypothetical protein BS78_01G011700 [Paspalum vaginatum]|nr:hypothetical protein BS78_01G011700 [Paspalum vaginatum]
MASTFSFPELTPAQIAEALNSYGLAPDGHLRADDIASPQSELFAAILSRLLANVACDDPDDQVGFEQLQALDNPEHHMHALGFTRLYRKAADFLESIQFRGLTLRDIIRPDPRRVCHILSAVVNFLHYRQEKLELLQPIVEEYAHYEDRNNELRARIAELQKVKADHLRKEQMEEPAVQQLQAEVNGLKQKIQEYNKQQMALRAKAKAMDEKKEEILSKISQADYNLMKLSTENSKLLSKIVQSPEKLQRTLEEKKATREELKNLEKMAMQKVQDKNNTLEMYTKVAKKLSKHLSQISALHEKSAAAKASEKNVKALKAQISDQSLEMKALHVKATEWQSKVHETEGRLKAKEKERDQRIEENNRMMTTLKSEVESEWKLLEDREKKTEEKISKASDLCSQTDLVVVKGRKKREEIHAKLDQVCKAANLYMDSMDRSMDEEAFNTITGQDAAGA